MRQPPTNAVVRHGLRLGERNGDQGIARRSDRRTSGRAWMGSSRSRSAAVAPAAGIELPIGNSALSLREIGAQALILRAYQDDRCGRSQDVPVLPTSPPAGVLPVGRRPVRARLPPGSGCSPVQRTRWIQSRELFSSRLRIGRHASTHQHQRDDRLGLRVRSRAACSSAHRLISGRSQSLTRPLPRSNTGLGMSLYRCWYWSTVLR